MPPASAALGPGAVVVPGPSPQVDVRIHPARHDQQPGGIDRSGAGPRGQSGPDLDDGPVPHPHVRIESPLRGDHRAPADEGSPARPGRVRTLPPPTGRPTGGWGELCSARGRRRCGWEGSAGAPWRPPGRRVGVAAHDSRAPRRNRQRASIVCPPKNRKKWRTTGPEPVLRKSSFAKQRAAKANGSGLYWRGGGRMDTLSRLSRTRSSPWRACARVRAQRKRISGTIDRPDLPELRPGPPRELLWTLRAERPGTTAVRSDPC